LSEIIEHEFINYKYLKNINDIFTFKDKNDNFVNINKIIIQYSNNLIVFGSVIKLCEDSYDIVIGIFLVTVEDFNDLNYKLEKVDMFNGHLINIFNSLNFEQMRNKIYENYRNIIKYLLKYIRSISDGDN
jgi:hypothetical protein